MIAPQLVSQNHYVSLAWTVFVWGEGTAKNRLHAQDRKECWRDARSAEGLGTLAAHVEAVKPIRRYLLKRMVLCLPIKVVGRGDRKQRHAGEALGGRNMPGLHDAGGILVGERAKEHAIDNGKDRGVGPDAERQDHDCGEGQPPNAQPGAQSGAKGSNQATPC